MKQIPHEKVILKSGFFFDKQELNRKTTVNAVYDRFFETGRINCFKFGYPEKDPVKPHYFWDSDVAKWAESAAYVLQKSPSAELEAKIDAIVEDLEAHQEENGYFNVYFTVVAPDKRWSNRDWHELYCAGHLMEAAVAYAEATGKTKFLSCMEKYADHIYKVFIEDRSAAFTTPGHEEIELALIKMFRYTKNKKYLEMAEFFLNKRGTEEDTDKSEYNQSHLPVREQTEAIGHSVRAGYLYTGMAYLAAETGEEKLAEACKTLWKDVTEKKMYVTGGLGSTHIGEAFTTPFDLPSDQAYTETCAGIALCFFADGMQNLDNNAVYADVIERALYNGVLSGLSLDGAQFFYENPLEINLSERFNSSFGHRRFPAHRRVACFGCSCCPPNLSRLLATLGKYVYAKDGETVYINQFADSEMDDGEIKASIKTKYPLDGQISVSADGVKNIAIRIPAWCDSFKIDRPYVMQNGYAVVENNGKAVNVELDLTPRRVWADARVLRTAGQTCIMKGPIVYCAEGIDNVERELHNYIIPADFSATESYAEEYGLPTLSVPCKKRAVEAGSLYRNEPPKTEASTLKLIPYSCFANREETDMRVWFFSE